MPVGQNRPDFHVLASVRNEAGDFILVASAGPVVLLGLSDGSDEMHAKLDSSHAEELIRGLTEAVRLARRP